MSVTFHRAEGVFSAASLFLQVQITLSTHDCGGLSQRDVSLATFIDQVSLM